MKIYNGKSLDMKTSGTKNIFKNIARFLLGLSWVFFVTTAFEIIPIAPNTINFLKTIFLTSNGSNTSATGIILEWSGGHGRFQWSVTVESLSNVGIVGTNASGKFIASTSGTVYNLISWFALAWATWAQGPIWTTWVNWTPWATWAKWDTWTAWTNGIDWINGLTWAKWGTWSTGATWAVWATWATWDTGTQIEMWTSTNYIQRRYVWWWRIDLISLASITWPIGNTWATWATGHITVINITQVSSWATSGQCSSTGNVISFYTDSDNSFDYNIGDTFLSSTIICSAGWVWPKWDQWDPWTPWAVWATWIQWIQWTGWIQWIQWNTWWTWAQWIQWATWNTWAIWWTWATGSSFFIQTGSNIYYNLWFLWIGVNNPLYSLDVSWWIHTNLGIWIWGQSITATDIINRQTAYTNMHTHRNMAILSGITATEVSNRNTVYGRWNHATFGYITWYTETDPKVWTLVDGKRCYASGTIVVCDQNTPAATPAWSDTEIQFNDWWSAFGSSKDLIWKTGRLGINTAAPSQALDVSGGIKGMDFISSLDNTWITVTTPFVYSWNNYCLRIENGLIIGLWIMATDNVNCNRTSTTGLTVWHG